MPRDGHWGSVPISHYKTMEKKMNRPTIPLSLAMLVLLLAPAIDAGDQKLSLSLTGQIFVSADTVYRDLHGQQEFMPQLALEYALGKRLLSWADLGFISSRTHLTELDTESRVSRLHGGFGLGYHLLQGPSLRLSLRSGLAIHHFEEEALDIPNSATRLGLRLGLCCDWLVVRKLFVRLSLSQSWVGYENEELSIALGGFQIGGGLGLCL